MRITAVENNYKNEEIVIIFSDGSESVYEVINGQIPIEIFRVLEIAMVHGSTIKVKGFV